MFELNSAVASVLASRKEKWGGMIYIYLLESGEFAVFEEEAHVVVGLEYFTCEKQAYNWYWSY